MLHIYSIAWPQKIELEYKGFLLALYLQVADLDIALVAGGNAAAEIIFNG